MDQVYPKTAPAVLASFSPAERLILFSISAGMVRAYVRMAYDACRNDSREEGLRWLQVALTHLEECRLLNVPREIAIAKLDTPEALRQLDYCIEALGLPKLPR